VIWVSILNGGGVGWGEVINGGFGMVLVDLKEEASSHLMCILGCK
jgi:urocanate hydratase